MDTRTVKALRALGYTMREDEGESAETELREVTASPMPVELRESGRIGRANWDRAPRTTGQPLPSLAELEQRMTVALRDIRQSSADGALTAVNRTQQPQKGAAALSESSTPTPAQRIAAALKSIQGGR